jgi:hypothetical protein
MPWWIRKNAAICFPLGMTSPFARRGAHAGLTERSSCWGSAARPSDLMPNELQLGDLLRDFSVSVGASPSFAHRCELRLNLA